MLNSQTTHSERAMHLFLDKIHDMEQDLTHHFDGNILTDRNLTRKVVSFQANKAKPQYRWYKYKEAFSADLVEYLLNKYETPAGTILDPFAGAGTALFAGSSIGFDADGIELLPVGQRIIEARLLTLNGKSKQHLEAMKRWITDKPWEKTKEQKEFSVLRITAMAYPKETETLIKKYLACLESEKSSVASLLLFALLCVLETISYTRKDGQYLRWDYRSGRRGFGKKEFNKGEIASFTQAICDKLNEIVSDLQNSGNGSSLFSSDSNGHTGKVRLLKGSCLNVLPTLPSGFYSSVITSPPYCNRYDYTRTYALEHAILGVSEEENLRLRQSMISCTVENREKELLSMNAEWKKATDICGNLPLLSELLSYLDSMKRNKALNNNGIPRMVRGYFYEMACVIQECFRVLKQGGYMFMVNDNVRYAGASISVDLLLSKIAEEVGFTVENILSLPQTKGNSSQQMGAHGRDALRKCVYIWRK
ncbi:MAG: site-specific DNA-methyltransferase [Candidatus Dadabacteria bacterium]|nr:site-specific DNA-methyltransferase [Candidatus Dadabacteria bacterium]